VNPEPLHVPTISNCLRPKKSAARVNVFRDVVSARRSLPATAAGPAVKNGPNRPAQRAARGVLDCPETAELPRTSRRPKFRDRARLPWRIGGGNHGQSASPQPRMPPADPTTRQPRPRSVSPKCSHAIRGESRCPPVVYRSHTASSPPRRTVRSTVPASPVSEGIDHRTFVTAVRTVVLRSGARRKCPTLTATRGTL
jgi:hypothetical protein